MPDGLMFNFLCSSVSGTVNQSNHDGWIIIISPSNGHPHFENLIVRPYEQMIIIVSTTFSFRDWSPTAYSSYCVDRQIPLGKVNGSRDLRSQLGLLQYSFISEGPTHPSMSSSFLLDESSPPSTEHVRERDRVPCPQVTEQTDHSVQQLQTPLHGWRLQARSIKVGPSQSDDRR